MKKRTIYFISGLPRSGSSLLCNILAQNPKFHVTSTNGLLELITLVRDNWNEIVAFKAQGLDEVMPKIKGSLNGIISGFYEDSLNKDMIVFDKDRGWINNIEFIEEVLGYNVKIITCVRDIKDISASFEKLYQKNNLISSAVYSDNVAKMSVRNRTADLLSDVGIIGSCVNMIRDIFTKKLQNRLIFIPFNNLTKKPGEILYHLHSTLEISQFNYKFTDMEQLISEDDYVYGIPGLHTIGKDVIFKPSDAVEMLGQELCDEIDNAYIDVKNII